MALLSNLKMCSFHKKFHPMYDKLSMKVTENFNEHPNKIFSKNLRYEISVNAKKMGHHQNINFLSESSANHYHSQENLF